MADAEREQGKAVEWQLALSATPIDPGSSLDNEPQHTGFTEVSRSRDPNLGL